MWALLITILHLTVASAKMDGLIFKTVVSVYVTEKKKQKITETLQ